MNRDVVLYLGGGAMSGVFGAGVMTALQEQNVYDRIEAIYAASAGACNGAYFLTHQAYIGSSIYYEDLLNHFIQGRHIPYGLLQRWWNYRIRPIAHDRIKNAVDIKYMIDVMRSKKVLDLERLKKQEIPLYIKLLEVKTGNIEYFDIRKYNPLDILHAATSVAPYYYSSHTINGKIYIDAVIKEPIGSDYLFRKHPNSKIVIQMNRQYEPNPFASFVQRVEERVLLGMYGKYIREAYAQSGKQRNQELQRLQQHANVLIIQPDKRASLPPHETNKECLLYSYQAGRQKGLEIVDWIS